MSSGALSLRMIFFVVSKRLYVARYIFLYIRYNIRAFCSFNVGFKQCCKTSLVTLAGWPTRTIFALANNFPVFGSRTGRAKRSTILSTAMFDGAHVSTLKPFSTA